MSTGRRQEAARRLRLRAADARRADSLNQANLGAYLVAALFVSVMFVCAFFAGDGVAALGLTCQTATVLLLSPELIRPLGRLPYLRRSMARIRRTRRRLALLGTVLFAAALLLLGARIKDLAGFGSDTDLLGVVVLLAMLLGFLFTLVFYAVWMVEGIFEGAADSSFEEGLRRLDPVRAREVRLALAAGLFTLGTLLLLVDTYR